MNGAFLTLVNMSISAGWIVLAVVLLRLLLKKAPKWITVLLWGVVAVRLVCPFSFESALSLLPSGQTISPEIMTDAQPQIDSGIPIINDTFNPIISNIFAPNVSQAPAIPDADVPTATEDAPPALPDTGTPVVIDSANPLQIWIPIFAGIWLVGVAAMLIYMVISYCRVRNRVQTAVLRSGNIYQCETVVSPFILGVLKPKIYLPFYLDGQDMSYVVAHEQAHLHRKDHLWKPLGFVLLSVYWFNPLLWLGYILLCRDIELACDEKVVQKLETKERADYSEALLNCSVNRRVISACPLTFGEVGVRQRVKSVLNYKKPAFWVVVIAVVALIVASVCLLTDPLSKDGDDTLPQAYVDILEEKAQETGKASYIRIDMDGDEIRELITSEYKNCAITVYTLVENEAVKVGEHDFVTAAHRLLDCRTKDRFGLVAVTTGGGQNYYAHMTIKDGKLHFEKMFDDDFSGILNYAMTKYITDEDFISAAKTADQNEQWLAWTEYTSESPAPTESTPTAPTNPTTPTNPGQSDHDKALFAVANNERPFIYGNSGPGYLRDFVPNAIAAAYYQPREYAFWDLDCDGENELILHGAPENHAYLVLHMENNQIYGYTITHRGFQSPRDNGVFCSSGGASFQRYQTISFRGSSYTIENAAIFYYYAYEEEKNVFEIGGKAVSYDEIRAYVDDWNSRPEPQWTDLTQAEGGVEQVIPENLAQVRQQLVSNGKTFGIIALGSADSHIDCVTQLKTNYYGTKYPFLSSIPQSRFISSGDGKITFAIIPADENAEVTVHKWVSTDGANTFHKGEQLYSGKGEPIIVKCNFSDIFPDCLVTVSGVEINPKTGNDDEGRIGIREEIKDKVLDLSRYTALTESSYFITSANTMSQIYTEFLYGQSYAVDAYGSVTIAELNRNPTIDYSGEYTLFDMNQDGTPELFVRLTTGLYILTYRQNQLVLLTSSTYTTLLNNGHLYYRRDGGGPPNVNRYYIIPTLSEDGAYSDTRVHFVEYHSEGSDRYMIDGEDVTKEEYDRMVEKVEQIGDDEILWTALPTITA